MVGASAAMREVFGLIDKAVKVEVPVLIAGETGTGKELVAREVHARGARAAGPFVAVNTGALSHELVGSELFGHVKGSFTGAYENKKGRYEEANGGVLFLDEIATMEERVQVSLLRVLETGTFRPVGGKEDRHADVRLIAATNEDLASAAHAGRFREDLLHRLQVYRINLPPLRDHLEDLPMLIDHFVEVLRTEFKMSIDGVSEECRQAMCNYQWPGNVRELKNVLAQACVVCEAGTIEFVHLPQRLRREVDAAAILPRRDYPRPNGQHGQDAAPRRELTPVFHSPTQDGVFIPVGARLDEVQKAYVLKTLSYCSNNKTQAAKMLGVSRKTLYDKLARWNVMAE